MSFEAVEDQIGAAVEVALLVLIVRSAWTWPRLGDLRTQAAGQREEVAVGQR
jgi:hypothetical protein